MSREVLEDEMKDLSLDFLIDQVHSWKHIWEQAACRAAMFPLEARQIVARKTTDPTEALEELVPLIAGLHPDVIKFTVATLTAAIGELGRLRDDQAEHDDSQTIVTEPDDDDLTLEERIERLETIVQGMGAITHPLRNN